MGVNSKIKSLIKLSHCAWLLALLLLVNINSGYTKDLTEDYLKSKPNGNSFDKKRWEKLKNDYKYKSPTIDTTKRENKQSGPFSLSGASGFMKIVAYLCIFLVLAGVIYLLARFGFLGDKKLKKQVLEYDINSEPEDINELEIDPLLAAAIKNGDYRLATRLQFLALIQALNQKKLIQWKRERTNQFYIQQLWGNKLQLPFRQLCLIYETVWYGDYPIGKNNYQTVDDKFRNILSLITEKEYV